MLRQTADPPSVADAAEVIGVPRRWPGDDLYGWTPAWAPALVRHRWLLAVLWAALHLLCFNGQWRIGLDSAKYRQLGHSLATGQGYTVFGEAHGHIYPGLPLMLGGLEWLLGPEPAWPAIAVMLLMSACVVLLVYALARRVLPAWGATLVAAGVAFNYRFVQQAHELMTDLPFLLGIVLTLWGIEAVRGGPRWRGALAVLGGVLLAASMRPTFWVLAAACVGWATIVVLRGLLDPRRRRSAIVGAAGLLAVVVIVWAFLHLDPRQGAADGGGIGGYEAEILARLDRFPQLLGRAPGGLWNVLNDDLPRLFFAERVAGLNPIFTLALLGGVMLLGLRRDDRDRRRTLWPLVVLGLFLAVLVASSEPRYWLMVLPILWAGWVIGLAQGASKWFASPRARSIYVAAGALLVVLPNLGHVGKLIAVQRATPFLSSYKGGEYLPVIDLARVLRERTAPGDTIIAPYANIVQYLSGRRVYNRRDIRLGETTSEIDRMVLMREVDGGEKADWMLFPKYAYASKGKEVFRLIDSRAVYPANPTDDDAIMVGTYAVGDGPESQWWLAPYEIDELRLPNHLRRRLPPDPEQPASEPPAP